MQFPATALYAAVLTTLMIALAFRVAATRRVKRIGVGDGGSKTLLMYKSAHENAVDNIPLALLLLLMLELQGASALLLHATGSALVTARLAHAWGISHSPGHSRGRFYGIIATWILLGWMGIANLVIAWR